MTNASFGGSRWPDRQLDRRVEIISATDEEWQVLVMAIWLLLLLEVDALE